ncbi:MAG TPA: RsmE family RNA methyltransferase [Terriglobales bacterium]|nr:RsmE family RNA methyltransferase [Terriglobales bacterium]
MTRRRWIADEVSGRRAALTGTHADHLIRVLRVRVGQEFDVGAGSSVYRARVAAIADQRVEFELEEEVVASSVAQITLVLAIIKFDRMEWAIEKCTEIGVSRFIPCIAARTDTHLAHAAVKRVERWRRIAREASEQSRRISPPEIADPAKLKDVVALSRGTRIFLSESEQIITLLAALQTQGKEQELFLVVGPEGGWTDNEEKLFRDCGWISASLGPTILRAETAAIVASAIATQVQ